MITKIRKIYPKIYIKNIDERYIRYNNINIDIVQYKASSYTHFWKIGDEMWVINVNYRLDYVSLEVFCNNKSIGNVFTQNEDYIINHEFPKGLNNYSIAHIVKILRKYIS